MPGHIKLVKGAVDPDPTDFLWPTMDMKKEDQAKPYDPKASVWIMDPRPTATRRVSWSPETSLTWEWRALTSTSR